MVNMGQLKLGATYVYDQVDNRIYVRELGHSTRQLVGWSTVKGGLAWREYSSEINHVLQMCETDTAMREMLDQLFVLYNLKKPNE